MSAVISKNENIFSFLDYIEEPFATISNNLYKNQFKDDFDSYNKIYQEILINLGIFTKFSPVIKYKLLEIPEFKEDLFYYYSSSCTIILHLWDFLKNYVEHYIFLTLNNEHYDFDYDLLIKYVQFIDNLSKLMFDMFHLKEKELNKKITATEYQKDYIKFEEQFDYYEKEFYLNYYEAEKSEHKNKFIKKVYNMEFMKDEIE
ncbi:MAG: hypothetical protein IJJ47_04190 [Methanosphaera sp.]|nr:hypothetical protein [Methanosphaera sp.]